MIWLTVAVLVWLVVCIPVALLVGAAIELADRRERRRG